MGPITIVFGVVLIALGAVGYASTWASTALIPAYFGLGLAVCGGLALKEHLRKHAMHLAALVGLVGFIGALVMVILTLTRGEIERPTAFAMQIAMAGVCVVFVGLCVKSFIDARRRRKQGAGLAGETPAPRA
jgi:uncharacterized membrane protein